MDLLQNIDKNMYISNNVVKRNVSGILKSLDDTNKVMVKAYEISVDEKSVSLEIVDITNLDELLDRAIEEEFIKYDKEVAKYKKVLNKIISCWENTPEQFKKEKTSWGETIYTHKTLLTDNEYHAGLSFYFGSYSKYNDKSFTTGCGDKTFYPLDTLKTYLDVDSWVENVKKEVKSTKIKTRIKKNLFKTCLQIRFNQIDTELSLTEFAPVKKLGNKGPFPMTISGSVLNGILSESGGDAFTIDEEFIEFAKEEYEVDFTPLIDWEIHASTDGYHNHDGQVCDYTVVFSPLEGDNYHAYNSHCLVTGWNFRDEVKIS